MATTPKKHDVENINAGYGTSHYLGKLNQLYTEQRSQKVLSLDAMDEDTRLDLVAEFLRILKESDNSPIAKFESTVRSKLRTDKSLIKSVIELMEDSELISSSTGKIRLTSSGKEVLK